MRITDSLSLFAVGIKGIVGFLSLLNDIHTPGIIICLLQQWQMNSEGWGAALSSIKMYMCISIIFTLISHSFVSFWNIATIISKHVLCILFASSNDLNVSYICFALFG